MRWNYIKKLMIKLLTGSFKADDAWVEEKIKNMSLAEAIAKVDWVFGCDRLLQEFDQDLTIPYYIQSEWAYQTFHSQDGGIHLALNFDGVFNPDGYYAQPRIVGEQIVKNHAKQVLELGSGKGFNGTFLANQYPDVNFVGIDVTPLHIEISNQKAKPYSNLRFQQGDFNQLKFPNDSFDLVFGIECLCYAQDPQACLAEIYRVLRSGGELVVFDSYRYSKFTSFSKLLQTATKLVEMSMVVRSGFDEFQDWSSAAAAVGFEVEVVEDLYFAILPNVLRLQKLAALFFLSSWRAKLLAYLLPKYLIQNSVAGLLMPFTLKPPERSLAYYQIILKKPIK